MYISRNVDYFEKLLDKRRSYFNCLKIDNHDLKKIAIAFEKAHDIRKFEISLYWQRSTFILGFLSVLAATLAYCFSTYLDKTTTDDTKFILLLTSFAISILAFSISMIWKRMIKAGKYWQNNWEFHINILEPFVSGNLYKMHFYKRKGNTRYSIHDIMLSIANRIITLLILLIFTILFLIFNDISNWVDFSKLKKEQVYISFAFLLIPYLLFEARMEFIQLVKDLFKKDEVIISSNNFKVTHDKFDFSANIKNKD